MGSRLRDARNLFELFCEVSPGDQTREAHVVYKFPDIYKHEEELRNLPKFTFPCKFENSYVQHYSFVLTAVDSKHTFCFCRYDPNINRALVLLSYLPWHDIFYKLLNCIANLISSPEKRELTSFLEACRIRPPMPGHTLNITINAGRSVFSCECPGSKLPSIPENCNLTEYFSAVDANCMAGLWAALLNERRIAIVASKPSRLSACVQAANATLFPMSWQHIFIPILPLHLVDYLLAPMPFLIGVPRSVMNTVQLSDIGDVVILDVDANRLKSPHDDIESLPADLVTKLIKSLGDKHALGDAVSRAFLRALVCLIGGYRDAIRIEKGQLITFNEEAFIKTRKHMQPFLRKMLDAQIFRQFIDERLNLLNSGHGFSDEFEIECSHYLERIHTGSGQKIKQQYRDWAKNVKKEGGAFFKTVKDKANPAVQSAVKSVRQGGRNVKSAVRGLKNKMPKAGSRASSINAADDSRFSCGSRTPVSSSSSSSSPGHEPPPSVPLDLLTEMEFLFNKNADTRRSTSSLPGDAQTPLSANDKARTLLPNVPPRPPVRPHPPLRYPIISTRKLVDLSDAPTPPPRTHAPSQPMFVTNITKNELRNAEKDFHTTSICLTEGKDKAKLKLTLSNNQRRVSSNSTTPLPCNGGVNVKSTASTPGIRLNQDLRLYPNPQNRINKIVTESCDSVADLIKLDDSPTDLEDFDPLKCREKRELERLRKADSALLHEYGLDFSKFNLMDYTPTSSTSSSVPKGWTTFN